MRLNLWTEIRTVAEVARLGRVSAAVETLGMHHSTVIRHIDMLEEALRIKLFQRHARGYSATEAGVELLATATMVDDQFAQLLNRLEMRQDALSGPLIVTAIPTMDDFILPVIQQFQEIHPQVQITYLPHTHTYHLAYGEAHVALRAGDKPQHPDNVVVHLMDDRASLFAAPEYIARHGRPKSLDDLAEHRFVVGEIDKPRAPFNKWLIERVPESQIVLRTTEARVVTRAIVDGIGIGFLNQFHRHSQIVQLFVEDEPEEWKSQIWLVTHVDLHRTPKVQAFTRFMQERAKAQSVVSTG